MRLEKNCQAHLKLMEMRFFRVRDKKNECSRKKIIGQIGCK